MLLVGMLEISYVVQLLKWCHDAATCCSNCCHLAAHSDMWPRSSASELSSCSGGRSSPPSSSDRSMPAADAEAREDSSAATAMRHAAGHRRLRWACYQGGSLYRTTQKTGRVEHSMHVCWTSGDLMATCGVCQYWLRCWRLLLLLAAAAAALWLLLGPRTHGCVDGPVDLAADVGIASL